MQRTIDYRNNNLHFSKAEIIKADENHVTTILKEIINGKVVHQETLVFDWDKIPFKINDAQKAKLLEASNENKNR